MQSSPSAADIGDRHRRFTALALLCLGIIFASDAAGYLLGPGAEPWLRGVELTAAALTLLALAPMVLWKLRNRSRSVWRTYAGEGGVVQDMLNRSTTVSWGVTFLVLLLLEHLAEERPGAPSELFLATALAAMLLSFAVAFLVQDRDPGEPAPLEEERHA